MKASTMKILLVYPQQVNSARQRLNRSAAQLGGIAHTVREVLSRCNGVRVREFAYEHGTDTQALRATSNRRNLSPIFNDTDLVIDISPKPDVNIGSADFAGPVVHLSPTFSGSFICNDIMVKGRGRLLQSDVVRCVDQTREKHKYTIPSTHELDESMQYAAFSPLPTRVGDAFYRNPKEHALVLLNYPDEIRNIDTVQSDMQVLSETLHSVDNLRSITFVCESLDDLPMIQNVADGLRNALGLQPSIWGLRKGEYHDMYSIMAKSNVVLSGGSSLYADAIIRGIPVFPWRSEQAGTAPLAQTFIDLSNDRSAMLSKQQHQLNQLIDAQYLDGTLPNYRPCFEQMILEVINHSLHEEPVTIGQPETQNPKWVIAPAKVSEHRHLPDRLNRSIWNDRQKLLQFKQSDNKGVARGTEGKSNQDFTRL